MIDCNDGESALAGDERWEGGWEAFSRIDVNVRALRSGVEPRTEERGWVGKPKSRVGWMDPVWISPFSIHHVYQSMSFCSTASMSEYVRRLTQVSPSGEISSNPSCPQTTKARSRPINFRTSANVSPSSLRATPRTIRPGLDGLISGPRILKIVLKLSCRRIGAMCANAG